MEGTDEVCATMLCFNVFVTLSEETAHPTVYHHFSQLSADIE